MRPAERERNGAAFAVRITELIVGLVTVDLQGAGEAGEMRKGMRRHRGRVSTSAR